MTLLDFIVNASLNLAIFTLKTGIVLAAALIGGYVAKKLLSK